MREVVVFHGFEERTLGRKWGVPWLTGRGFVREMGCSIAERRGLCERSGGVHGCEDMENQKDARRHNRAR